MNPFYNMETDFADFLPQSPENQWNEWCDIPDELRPFVTEEPAWHNQLQDNNIYPSNNNQVNFPDSRFWSTNTAAQVFPNHQQHQEMWQTNNYTHYTPQNTYTHYNT